MLEVAGRRLANRLDPFVKLGKRAIFGLVRDIYAAYDEVVTGGHGLFCE